LAVVEEEINVWRRSGTIATFPHMGRSSYRG